MEEQVETMMGPQDPGPPWGPMALQLPSRAEMNKNLSTSSKPEGLAAAIAAELMIGFWFGVGIVLAVKTLECLEYCIRRKC